MNKVNESFERIFNESERDKLLEASRVFSLASKQTQRSNSSQAYIQADPGGKGIQRLKDIYDGFHEELQKRNGPRKAVNEAELLINKVFSNPVVRGTEIVTDPAFKDFVDKNKKLKPFNKNPEQIEVKPPTPKLIFEPVYRIEPDNPKRPEKGYQIGITTEALDKEKERYLERVTFLMQ